MRDDAYILPNRGIRKLGKRIVAADMIRINGCVDHPDDRLLRQLPNGRDKFGRKLFVLRIDHEHPVIADMYRHVPAGSDEHVHVALNMNRLNLNAVQICRGGL